MDVRVKRIVNVAILVAGLVLCIVSLVRLQAEHPLTWAPTVPAVIAFLVLAVAALAAMASAWQRYVLAFFDARLTLAHAAYQSCVMLVAKYVPVMVAGFIARVAAYSAHAPAGRVVFATLTELAGAVAAATLVGAACLISVLVPFATPVVIAIALAGVAFAPAWITFAMRILSRLRRSESSAAGIGWSDASRRALRIALAFQVLQWIVLAGFVAVSVLLVAPDTGASTLVVVSGAYALAIVVGIAIVFLPGGLGAREAAFVWLASPRLGAAEALQLALALRIAMSILDLIAGVGCVLLHRAADPRDRDAANPQRSG
jgi:uncharacterized membrane protein YbhN (UPF0104 family)